MIDNQGKASTGRTGSSLARLTRMANSTIRHKSLAVSRFLLVVLTRYQQERKNLKFLQSFSFSNIARANASGLLGTFSRITEESSTDDLKDKGVPLMGRQHAGAP